jgi:hypothetical protein
VSTKANHGRADGVLDVHVQSCTIANSVYAFWTSEEQWCNIWENISYNLQLVANPRTCLPNLDRASRSTWWELSEWRISSSAHILPGRSCEFSWHLHLAVSDAINDIACHINLAHLVEAMHCRLSVCGCHVGMWTQFLTLLIPSHVRDIIRQWGGANIRAREITNLPIIPCCTVL